MSKITLATTTKTTKQNPKSTRLYILGHPFLYIYLQSFFSLFFRGVQGGVLFRSLLDIKKKKFVDFVKVQVLELCTLSRAPPFFSVHFFLWRNFQPFVLVTTAKKNIKKKRFKNLYSFIFRASFVLHLLILFFKRRWVGGWMRGDGFNWTPKKRIHILTWPGPRTVL